MNPILSICYLLAAWLSLHGGTSRETSNAMLRALNFIVSATVTIFMAFIRSLGHDVPTPTLQLVRDIRTVYKVCEVEPTIIRTPCCPTCFSTFPSNAIPSICPWRKNPKRGKRCGETLLRGRQTRRGVKQVPKTYISTQSFDSWLRHFLLRPDIEIYLEQSFQKTHTFNGANSMHDISDSPAWQTFRPLLRSHCSLVFGIYIDWFNPFTNKIAGEC